MKRIINLMFIGLFLCLSSNAFADDCTHGIKGSGANLGPDFIQGKGTKSEPFILTDGMHLCDITLVKHAQKGDPNHNLSYPDDTIYFQYSYKNVPLNDQGILRNSLTFVLGTNSDSSFTSSPITDTHFPNDPNKPLCNFVPGKSVTGTKAYDAVCWYNGGPSTPNDFKLSGTVNFSISLVGDQEIRKFVDSNGLNHGAADLNFRWLNRPQSSNFNM